jgi:Spy/CpxP family protein refolding chaperone
MMSFRRLSVWTAIPLLGALLGVTGCGADTASAKATDPTEEAAQGLATDKAAADTRADRPEGPRGHGPGGPEHLLMAALHELDLTAAQKTTIQAVMEKLAPPARGDHGPRDTAAFTALSAGIRAGKIDTAVVLAGIGAPGSGPDARLADVATALSTLHATLTKEQRRALVDGMAKRMAEHGPPPGAPPPDMGDRDRDHGPGPDHGPGFDHDGGPLGHMLSGLSLTAAQRTSIDTALAAQRPAMGDRDAMKKQFEARGAQMRARMESFASDTFDAKAFVAPPADAPQGAMMHPLARMVNELAVVVPLLDPAQREALAVQLEKGPGGMMGPPGGREHGPGAR